MNKLIALFLGVGLIAWFGFKDSPGEYQADGTAKVVLFVIDGCPPCRDAEAFLKRWGVEVEVVQPLQRVIKPCSVSNAMARLGTPSW